MDKIENLKRNLANWENLERKVNIAEKEWEKDPENKELEKAFDQVYKMEWEALREVINSFAAFAGIEKRVARHFILKNREDLKKLLWSC